MNEPTQAQRDLASDICFTVSEHSTERDRDVVARMIANAVVNTESEKKGKA